jgi:hypothetical protein
MESNPAAAVSTPSEPPGDWLKEEGGRTRERGGSDKRRRRGLREASTSTHQHACTSAATATQADSNRARTRRHARSALGHSGALRRPIHGVAPVASHSSCVLCCECCGARVCVCMACSQLSAVSVSPPLCRPSQPTLLPPFLATHATEHGGAGRQGREEGGEEGTTRSRRMQGARFRDCALVAGPHQGKKITFTKGPYFRIKERRTGASQQRTKGQLRRGVERVLLPCAPAVRKTKETGS